MAEDSNGIAYGLRYPQHNTLYNQAQIDSSGKATSCASEEEADSQQTDTGHAKYCSVKDDRMISAIHFIFRTRQTTTSSSTR